MSETKIAPGFLVAAPQLRDPHFESTVILMLDHDDAEGSMGLVINRPAPVKLDRVLAEMKLKPPELMDLAAHPPLLYGGPVSPEQGWILHTPDFSGDATKEIDNELSVTVSMDVLDAIAAGDGPEKYRFCLGYSGWGPHQLIEEIKTGAWINVPFELDLIFDTPIDETWNKAISLLGIDPSKLVSLMGDA